MASLEPHPGSIQKGRNEVRVVHCSLALAVQHTHKQLVGCSVVVQLLEDLAQFAYRHQGRNGICGQLLLGAVHHCLRFRGELSARPRLQAGEDVVV